MQTYFQLQSYNFFGSLLVA